MSAQPGSWRRGAVAAPAMLRLEWVHKSFAAGITGCSARVRVLTGARMVVRPAEFVAVAGDAGAGKSTLLLCASGFLHTDLGSVRWGPAAADGAQRAYLPCAAGIAAANPAALLCVDDVEDVEALRDAVAPALARGAAVLAAVRDAAGAAAAGARVSILREGRLVPLLPPPEPARAMTRVAERERGGVDPFAWRA